MKNGLMEVYDVTRLVDEFSGEEYRGTPFKGTGIRKNGLGCLIK